MPPLQLIVLAAVAMTGLAALRVVRFRAGRTPLPEVRGRRLALLAFVVVPPLVLATITQSPTPGQARGVSSVPIYIVVIGVLVVLMAIASRVVGIVAHGPRSRLIRVGLVGREIDEDEVRRYPPLTANLAERVKGVAKANASFSRGPGFAAETERAGFRADWDALDGATRALEDRIAGDYRLGLGVAYEATAIALDARIRLDTLRGVAADQGRGWAS
jgi:hypothetical protein